VTINVDGVDRVFKGSIGPFSSDNLGAHTIGGFIECFSSLRICRVCMATSDEIQYLVIVLIIVYSLVRQVYMHLI
jgi:hypothetical protein